MPRSQPAASEKSHPASTSHPVAVKKRADTAPTVAALVDASGTLLRANSDDVHQRITAGQFFWLDVFTRDAVARRDLISGLGLDSTDSDWILRFGQAPRMTIWSSSVRVVTMVMGPGDRLAELHVLWTAAWVVTVWEGDAASLQEVRQRFATRLRKDHETAPVFGPALLLLLLSTFDEGVTDAYGKLYALEQSLDGSAMTDPKSLRLLRRRIQREFVHADRYRAAVRCAVADIDGVPGMDAKATLILKEYADEVEDLAHRLESLTELSKTVSDEVANSLAHLQSRRINQLTAVSVIFLPVTFLTGFFGMNFQWMIDRLGSRDVFLVLAVALPVIMVAATVLLLTREGINLRLRRPSSTRSSRH